MRSDAYISLGSNIGDRELNLLMAVAEIGKLSDSKVTALSPFYETSPVGNLAQDNFYNAVLKLETGIAPRPLLDHLLRIEKDHFNRQRLIPQGPRRMDLDLLLYGDDIIADDGLIIPHPRLTERRFVLQPLCAIAPQLLHPVCNCSVSDLLAALKSDEKVVAL